MKVLKDYRIFELKEEVDDVEQLLIINDFKYFIQESNDISDKKYLLQLKPQDFEKVDKLCESLVEIDFEILPKDYYLLEYTNEELTDIISNRSEWSEFDYVLATKILEKRNIIIDDHRFPNNSEKNEYVDLSVNESINSSFINGNFALSYFLAIFFGPYFLIRYFIIISAKERLEDGNLVFKYDKKIRSHAIVICFLGLLSTLFWLIIFKYNYFKNLG